MDIRLFVWALVIYVVFSSMCLYAIYCVWTELRRVTGYKKPTKTKQEYI
jgi:hypothetical protein